MRKSDFVKWIWSQLNGQKKEEDVIDAVMDDSLPGKYIKEIKMQVPNIECWTRDFSTADTIRGTCFLPTLGESIRCKAELIESDYMDCLDIWMKRNSLREGDSIKQVYPMIKFVYADVPQGVHKDQDKDAKGKLRKEDDHEEDPKKVCTVFFVTFSTGIVLHFLMNVLIVFAVLYLFAQGGGTKREDAVLVSHHDEAFHDGGMDTMPGSAGRSSSEGTALTMDQVHPVFPCDASNLRIQLHQKLRVQSRRFLQEAASISGRRQGVF
jgi:hypothetical protein